MNEAMASEYIVNFIRKLWQRYFPNHRKTPVTLYYDPLSTMNSLHAGICHIAHNYLSIKPVYFNPDDHIYAIIPDNNQTDSKDPNNIPIKKINTLPELECIVFTSMDTARHQKILEEKLSLRGLAIIINECAKPPVSWKKVESFEPSKLNAENLLKSLEAYQKY